MTRIGMTLYQACWCRKRWWHKQGDILVGHKCSFGISQHDNQLCMSDLWSIIEWLSMSAKSVMTIHLRDLTLQHSRRFIGMSHCEMTPWSYFWLSIWKMRWLFPQEPCISAITFSKWSKYQERSLTTAWRLVLCTRSYTIAKQQPLLLGCSSKVQPASHDDADNAWSPQPDRRQLTSYAMWLYSIA